MSEYTYNPNTGTLTVGTPSKKDAYAALKKLGLDTKLGDNGLSYRSDGQIVINTKTALSELELTDLKAELDK